MQHQLATTQEKIVSTAMQMAGIAQELKLDLISKEEAAIRMSILAANLALLGGDEREFITNLYSAILGNNSIAYNVPHNEKIPQELIKRGTTFGLLLLQYLKTAISEQTLLRSSYSNYAATVINFQVTLGKFKFARKLINEMRVSGCDGLPFLLAEIKMSVKEKRRQDRIQKLIDKAVHFVTKAEEAVLLLDCLVHLYYLTEDETVRLVTMATIRRFDLTQPIDDEFEEEDRLSVLRWLAEMERRERPGSDSNGEEEE
jgi:transcriptional regulator CtsR